MAGRFLILSVVVLALGAEGRAQQGGSADVEVDPITCWWRTSATAVRVGQPFGLTLTCSVVEAESARVVPDVSRLDPAVVQLPPFEILGGGHAADIVVPGRRFFQYDYRLRLVAEDAFGGEAAVPPLEIVYRIESTASGGDTVQGRDLTYALPRASIQVISLVPGDTTDIRETPAPPFASIESRVSRGSLLRTLAALLAALAGLALVAMLVGAIRRRGRKTSAVVVHVHARAILAAVTADLDAVGRESRGGWSVDLAARALTAARIAGSYAVGRAVGQRPVRAGEPLAEGQLVVRGRFGRGGAHVSGSVTAESAGTVPGLADALRTLTRARYGRTQAVDPAAAEEAVAAVARVAREQASRHSLVAEWAGHLADEVGDLRKRIGL